MESTIMKQLNLFFKILLCVLLSVCIILLSFDIIVRRTDAAKETDGNGSPILNEAGQAPAYLNKVTEILGLIDTYYVDDYTTDQLGDYLAAAVISSTGDRWSYYVSAEERLKMCRLMFPNDKFTVSDLEIKREGKSYTIDTLKALCEEYPGAKFYLIIGSDMLLSFHRWYRYEDILKKCTLCVMTRESSVTKGEMLWYAGSTLGLSEKDMVLSDAGAYEMSSTLIREKIAKKEDVSDCLTKEVEDYIKEKGLYL